MLHKWIDIVNDTEQTVIIMIQIYVPNFVDQSSFN